MKYLFLNELVSDRLLIGARRYPQIVERQGHDQLRRYGLYVSTRDNGKGRAQDLVSSPDFVDAPLQDSDVARRRQPKRMEDIEEGHIRQAMLQPPQSFLRAG